MRNIYNKIKEVFGKKKHTTIKRKYHNNETRIGYHQKQTTKNELCLLNNKNKRFRI